MLFFHLPSIVSFKMPAFICMIFENIPICILLLFYKTKKNKKPNETETKTEWKIKFHICECDKQ